MVDFRPPVAPLFVPASRPDRFHKADESGADAIILDLEDAVAPTDKERARDAVIGHLAGLKSPVIVRINASGTPWHEGDLEALTGLKDVTIMLPKAERPEEITNAVLRIGRSVPVIALIETAVGLARLPDLLSVENVVMAAFGSVDFSLDLGCAHERMALLNARSEIVWRSRAARRAAPLDGVTTDLSNPEMTKDDVRHAAALGFGGKLAIHPKQVEQIRQAYRPDEQTVTWACNIVSKTASGEAIQVNGEMVDRPVMARARLILSRADIET
ncbi:HpcH/HpaI aldolase/citrate lyase family protein [Pararhizobium sp. LjRoot238]|uniref:HpcH/HpaI aldolase/citrate lyase family protein n=1 Tax=Pararhizobium sp. LjRoot238 TaxID=3342293 RepID=UPI003ECFD1E1